MNTITLTANGCQGCPMIWECILPDGSEGYIKYRWSEIGLYKVDEMPGIFRDPIVWKKIGSEDGLDGILELSEAIAWLEKQGYEIENKIKKNQTNE